MDISFAFLTIVLALLAAYFFNENNRLRMKVDRLRSQELKEQRELFYDQNDRIKKLEEANTKLEQSNRKRLPYDKAAALEDAIAVKLEIERERSYLESRERQLMEILQMARGEEKYDADRPSGRRPY